MLGGMLAVFFALRSFFFVFPEAFTAYPESLPEYSFYSTDLLGKLEGPSAQILLMGTSRMQFLGNPEIDPAYRREGGYSINISLPGNTFWHMAIMRRRNPTMWDKADLVVSDIGAMQILPGRNFDESAPFFLRESTLAERWLVYKPTDRLRALADWAVPLWSRRYTPDTWWKALTHLNATDAERLTALTKANWLEFPEYKEWIEEGEEIKRNPERARELLLELDYPVAPYSRVQEHALRELAANPPPNGVLLLVHPPHRNDLQQTLETSETRKQLQPMLRELVEPLQSDRVVLRWYSRAAEFDLVDEDFADDGLHFTRGGVLRFQRFIDEEYRKFYGLPLKTQAPAP